MPQSLSSILIHLVFSTKNRDPLISAEIAPELHAYMAAVFRACHSPALSINGTGNHVHSLFALSRRVTVADVVEEVKKRSSKWAKAKGPSLRNFRWQTGYGAFSIGQSNVPALLRYIAKQEEHHRR
ncbi:MAG TPA: transposase, partial [Pyrinomonadaceae bacterium]|nr:transposase [Pyrinomonadaceae bacterium]